MTPSNDSHFLAFSGVQNRIITTSLTVLCCGALLCGLFFGGILILNFLGYFVHIIGPLIVAFYLSLLTRPWYELLLRWTKERSIVAVILFSLSFLLPLSILCWLFGAFIIDQLNALPGVIVRLRESLIQEFPDWREQLVTLLPDWTNNSAAMVAHAASFADTGWAILAGILKAGTTALLWLLTFFYWVIFVQMKPLKGVEFARHLPFLSPRGRHACARYFNNFNDIIVSYFRGQIIDVTIQGLLYGLAFQIAGLPSGFIIGFTVGVLNLLPYLGAIVGFCFTIPLAFYTGGLDFALAIATIICCIQTFDGYIMQPYIQGSRMKLSAWQIVFALLFWAQVAGFLGVLLAIPITAFIKASWGEWRLESERFVGDSDTHHPPEETL